MLPRPAESAAALEAQAAAEVSATLAQVAADKEAAKAALANPDAAWDAFLASQQTQIAAAKASSAGDPLPQHLSVLDADIAAGPRALGKRKQVFVRNLRGINKRNGGSGDMLAFGVNNFTALSAKEFKKIYLSSIIPPTGWGAGSLGAGALPQLGFCSGLRRPVGSGATRRSWCGAGEPFELHSNVPFLPRARVPQPPRFPQGRGWPQADADEQHSAVQQAGGLPLWQLDAPHLCASHHPPKGPEAGKLMGEGRAAHMIDAYRTLFTLMLSANPIKTNPLIHTSAAAAPRLRPCRPSSRRSSQSGPPTASTRATPTSRSRTSSPAPRVRRGRGQAAHLLIVPAARV